VLAPLQEQVHNNCIHMLVDGNMAVVGYKRSHKRPDDGDDGDRDDGHDDGGRDDDDHDGGDALSQLPPQRAYQATDQVLSRRMSWTLNFLFSSKTSILH